ncbi:MAG: FHIPEP family type III secretion protein [Treponema sp.]|nr:FHIPEP family type III secretion protein [Treponema sp.]
MFNVSKWFSGKTKLISVLVIGIIILLIIPFPAVVLDIFIGLNLLSVLLLLFVVLFTKKITDFSSFPAVLLISTVVTLAINIAVTRMVLTIGPHYDGKIINALSNIIAGSHETGRLMVGYIIFIVIFSFMLFITVKGGTRVSEAAVRFTLDSMQVKLMAVDTEFSAGVLSEEQALAKKQKIQKEADFYGSLDGAAKFISDNAKIASFILYIIIIAGVIVDYFFRETALLDAVKTYMYLSVGCGIVFLLPSFIISLTIGIIISRLVLKD